jgi:hypothetical protein
MYPSPRSSLSSMIYFNSSPSASFCSNCYDCTVFTSDPCISEIQALLQGRLCSKWVLLFPTKRFWRASSSGSGPVFLLQNFILEFRICVFRDLQSHRKPMFLG